ncbi:RecQ-mediated genome instability protein 2 [Balamuthia mandrillaris]
MDLCSKKMFVGQLEQVEVTEENETLLFRFGEAPLFQRVWVQGVVVFVEDKYFYLDDGSGVVFVDGVKSSIVDPTERNVGDYLMVIGTLGLCTDGTRTIIAVKICNLNEDPNRETLWDLEVIEAQRRFYLPA